MEAGGKLSESLLTAREIVPSKVLGQRERVDRRAL